MGPKLQGMPAGYTGRICIAFAAAPLSPAEKGHRYGTGTGMGANDAANQRGFQPIDAVFPQGTAVLHIFFQKYIRQTRITQQNGQLKVDAAAGTKKLISKSLLNS